MTIRERFEHALAGEVIEQPVYAVYDWFVINRAIDWQSLFDLGLGQINHALVVEYTQPNVEIRETTSTQNAQVRRDVRWITDIGELHEWYLGEWRQEYLIKTPEDYKIMAYALSDSTFSPTNTYFDRSEVEVGDNGITLGHIDRTPFQKIQIDLVGLERFSLDLADQLPELLELLELMNGLKIEEVRCAAQSRAQQIKLWENISIETMGSKRYRQCLVPMYERILDILEGSGKKLQVHYDGALRRIAGDIQGLRFDGLDSLTPPPEGDMTTLEARQYWPDTFLWASDPFWYSLSDRELMAHIRHMAKDAGPKRYCMMISEEVPPEWQKTIPAVLKALNHL